ncbi:hypothetical protein HAX54_031094 [Datura stramonium]|uniref:Uncharacterized protein n=1 Tax=Datura stramonium TaxID=4076 RepID=A0ABS8VA10_DATST|nr:hypothetical protein [Datura stramonium]
MAYGNITAQFKENFFSNHSPIHTDVVANTGQNMKSFRFFNVFADAGQFLHIVKHCCSQNIQSSYMFQVWNKLKLCRDPLKQLKLDGLGSVDRGVEDSQGKLQDLQAFITMQTTTDLLEKEREAQARASANTISMIKDSNTLKKQHDIERGFLNSIEG